MKKPHSLILKMPNLPKSATNQVCWAGEKSSDEPVLHSNQILGHRFWTGMICIIYKEIESCLICY